MVTAETKTLRVQTFCLIAHFLLLGEVGLFLFSFLNRWEPVVVIMCLADGR